MIKALLKWFDFSGSFLPYFWNLSHNNLQHKTNLIIVRF